MINKEKLVIVKIIDKLTPDMKTSVNQDKNMSSVWPMSGCIISKRHTGIIAMKVSKYLM